jgi:hypothetical protein
MNVKSSTLNASTVVYFSGNNRMAQKNVLLLIAASVSLAFIGMQICCDKNAQSGRPTNCYVEQNFASQAGSGKWSYDEMAHKLIFEYGGKSRDVEGFSYKLGHALLKVSRKIDVKKGVVNI